MNTILQPLALWAIEGILGLVVVGLLILWKSHYEFKVEVAREYLKKTDLRERVSGIDSSVIELRRKMESDMGEMRRDITRILELVAEIRGKTNVHGTASG